MALGEALAVLNTRTAHVTYVTGNVACCIHVGTMLYM